LAEKSWNLYDIHDTRCGNHIRFPMYIRENGESAFLPYAIEQAKPLIETGPSIAVNARTIVLLVGRLENHG
jgi:hypothetical protein